jgi:hypothetical protein
MATETKHTSQVTTDHEEIQRWAEERGAKPACVRGTGGKGDIGILRLDFPGYTGEDKLEHIEWNEWFEKFDERGLSLLYQEETAAGERSNFNKLVSRETAEQAEHKGNGSTHGGAGKKTATKKRATRKK